MSDPCSIVINMHSYELTGFVAWADKLQMHGQSLALTKSPSFRHCEFIATEPLLA